MEDLKPSKMVNMTDIPETLMDKKLIRRHFSAFGDIRRVSIDVESSCCAVLFYTVEAAQKAYLNGNVINGHRVNLLLGSAVSPQEQEITREIHTYDDLEMQYLNDEKEKLQDDNQSEKDLLKMKKNLIRKLHEERENSSRTSRSIKKVPREGDKSKAISTFKRIVQSGLKKTNTAVLSSAELTKMKTLEIKYSILDLRDKIYREKLRASKLNVKVGTCPDMCPEKERIMRAYRKLWTCFEQHANGNRLAPELAVKEYSRSSANQEEPLPHELRPEPVLNMTINYLISKIMPLIEFPDIVISEWYDFLWDRLRGIRKDIVQQQLCSVNTAQIIEQCARFHILCFDRLSGQDAVVFDEKINTENLNNCLQSLLDMYDDLQERGFNSPNESEFRAYEILAKLDRGDIIWEFQKLKPQLQTSPEILFALEAFSAFKNNMFSTFFKLVRKTSYLNACLLQRYFGYIRFQALQSIVTTFCRPQDQNFKAPVSSIRSMLYFDTDSEVLKFCNEHGMVATEDGDLSIGKHDLKFIPKSTAYVSSSLNIIKSKRVALPFTVTASSELPRNPEHKVHSSFDASGKLKRNALNAKDQIDKLKRDFGFVVENMPLIEIDEKLFKQEEWNKPAEQSSATSDLFPASPKEISNNPFKSTSTIGASNIFKNPSSEEQLFKTSPPDEHIFKKSVMDKKSVVDQNIFKKSFGDEDIFKKPSTDENIFKTPSINENIFKKSLTDGNIFKKPLANENIFKKSSVVENIFKTPSTDENIFKKPTTDESIFKARSTDENIFKKPTTDENIFKKSKTDENIFKKPTTDENIFKKYLTDGNILQKPLPDENIFKKPSTDGNIFKIPSTDKNMFQKTITDENIFTKSVPDENMFKKPLVPPPSNLFGKSSSQSNLFDKQSSEIFKTETTFQHSSPFSKSLDNVFNFSGEKSPTFSTNSNLFLPHTEPSSGINIFEKGAQIFSTENVKSSSGAASTSFSDFMKPTTEPSFNFLQKKLELQDKAEPLPDSQSSHNKLNSGFEKCYEMFLKASEQQSSRKRVADEDKEDDRRKELEAIQAEKEKQRQMELEQETRRQMEIDKQRELEELKRQREVEEARQREAEELRRQKQRELELTQAREWEEKVKQQVLELKVKCDLQNVLETLHRAERRKIEEHQVEVRKRRKQKELDTLRRTVRTNVRNIKTRRCLRKWKEHVERLKINKLDFPKFVESSVENHIAVWGSVKQIKNHTPFDVAKLYNESKLLWKTPLLSNDNLYMGTHLVQLLSQVKVQARFLKQGCMLNTPLVWKVGFRVPRLSVEYSQVESDLHQFLRKLCYDDKHSLGHSECLKSAEHCLYVNYYVLETPCQDFTLLKGTHLLLLITSSLWETPGEFCTRLKPVIERLEGDTHMIVLIFRGSTNYKNVLLHEARQLNFDMSFVHWHSAEDVSNALVASFKRYFSGEEVEPLLYENLYDMLTNEVDALFMQLQLNLDQHVCKQELSKHLNDPNYLIELFNGLLKQLRDVVVASGCVSLPSELQPMMLKHKSSKILNNDVHHLDALVNKLFLPNMKQWPVRKLSKLKKVLKQFCGVIDEYGWNELYLMSLRRLNPPKENFETYLSQLQWNKLLLECFLWRLRAHVDLLKNVYVFYDRTLFENKVRSYWWIHSENV